jgi:hypothetical protein
MWSPPSNAQVCQADYGESCLVIIQTPLYSPAKVIGYGTFILVSCPSRLIRCVDVLLASSNRHMAKLMADICLR